MISMSLISLSGFSLTELFRMAGGILFLCLRGWVLRLAICLFVYNIYIYIEREREIETKQKCHPSSFEETAAVYATWGYGRNGCLGSRHLESR